MGKVIPLRANGARNELVEFYNEMAAKAARGEHTGVMYVAAYADADDEWGMCGSLLSDITRATALAEDGIEAFEAYKAELLHKPAANHPPGRVVCEGRSEFEHIARLLREA